MDDAGCCRADIAGRLVSLDALPFLWLTLLPCVQWNNACQSVKVTDVAAFRDDQCCVLQGVEPYWHADAIQIAFS
jgi:hypothetical protein